MPKRVLKVLIQDIECGLGVDDLVDEGTHCTESFVRLLQEFVHLKQS